MKNITLEELLEAGCHFGHQVTRQNPKARDYVFEARDNIHIIDLGKTKEGLDEAAQFVKDLAKRGGTMIVVGSKRQAQPIILEEVKRAKEELKANDGLFFVTSRWIGGTLTNFAEVEKNYKKLQDLASKLKDDFEKARYTKKEIGMWEKEKVKLQNFYGGIADMKALPDAVFVVDTHTEHLAVSEANRTNIKVVGVVDTNANPDVVDYVIPANDDAVGSIKLLVSHIVDAWIEGRQEAGKAEAKKESSKETSSEEVAEKKEEPKVASEEKKEKTTKSAGKKEKAAVK